MHCGWLIKVGQVQSKAQWISDLSCFGLLQDDDHCKMMNVVDSQPLWTILLIIYCSPFPSFGVLSLYRLVHENPPEMLSQCCSPASLCYLAACVAFIEHHSHNPGLWLLIHFFINILRGLRHFTKPSYLIVLQLTLEAQRIREKVSESIRSSSLYSASC